MGGMGSAVCELLGGRFPVPVEMVGMHDSFGESGTPAQLLKKYSMTRKEIKASVKKVLTRK